MAKTKTKKLNKEEQLIVDRAAKIREVLEENPPMAIMPFLRITTNGIKPDAKLVILDEKTTETQGEDSNSSE